MSTRAYRVSDVGGAPIETECLGKEKSSIHSVQFGDKRVKVTGSAKNRNFIINADLANAEVFFNIDDLSDMDTDGRWRPNELFFNIRFSVPFYTIQTKDTPVEMTLDEIEKKLGHKVLIVNNK